MLQQNIEKLETETNMMQAIHDDLVEEMKVKLQVTISQVEAGNYA